MSKKMTKRTPVQKKSLKSRCQVIQQRKPLPDPLTDETLLTREQVATYANCSVRTVVTWIKERGLPEVKQGRISRIRKGDLDQFLSGSSNPPAIEPAYKIDKMALHREEEAEKEEFRRWWKNMGYCDPCHETIFVDFGFDGIYQRMKEAEKKIMDNHIRRDIDLKNSGYTSIY